MALISREVNWRDPRYQRAQQRAQASPLGTTLGQQKSLINNFVGQQMKQKLGAAQNAAVLASHKDTMRLKNKEFDFRKDMFKKQRGNFWDDLLMTQLFGAGTAGINAWVGHNRALAEQAFAKKQEDHWDRIKLLYEAQFAKRRGAGPTPDWYGAINWTEKEQ